MHIHNIEIKLRVENPEPVRAKIEAMADGPAEVLEQRDTYLRTGGDCYLKMRRENGRSTLIAYRRRLGEQPAPSDIRLAQVETGDELLDALTHALGEIVTVEKTRRLYFRGQTRIHLDNVSGLGDFLELEVVLRPDQSETEGREIADGIVQQLGLESATCMNHSYRDLLRQPE